MDERAVYTIRKNGSFVLCYQELVHSDLTNAQNNDLQKDIFSREQGRTVLWSLIARSSKLNWRTCIQLEYPNPEPVTLKIKVTIELPEKSYLELMQTNVLKYNLQHEQTTFFNNVRFPRSSFLNIRQTLFARQYCVHSILWGKNSWQGFLF